MPRLNNHGTIRGKQLDLHNTLRFLHTNDTYHHDLVGTDATSANITTTLPNHTGTLLTHTIKDHANFETGKHLRFGSSNGGADCYMTGDNSKIDMVSPNLLLHGSTLASFRGGTVNIDAGGTLNLQASDAENYLVCNHSSEAVETIKPLHIKSTSKVEAHCNFLTDKELRFGTAGGGSSAYIKGDNSTMNINAPTINLQGTTATSLRGGSITIDAGGDLNLKASDNEDYIVCSHSNGNVEYHKPIDFGSENMTNVDIDSGTIDGTSIGSASASSGSFTTLGMSGTTIPTTDTTTTYTGDDGSIPITSTLVKIDAGGSARTGLRFAGAGTIGQMIVVANVGGEKLTFHNTEGTSLVKAIHANHDTMEPASVYMFISTGSLWCIIGGGKGSGTQLVAS